MARYPEHVNYKRVEDENTALHIAAANNRLEVLKHLCTIVSTLSCVVQCHILCTIDLPRICPIHEKAPSPSSFIDVVAWLLIPRQ